MTTVMIADDHQIFRESLSELLSKQGFKVLGVAANGKLMLDLLKEQTPDIVIMDIAMPEMDGYETALKALEMNPELKILTLSSFGDENYYYKMVEAGVKGFVLKSAGINELKQAMAEIIAGESWFSNELLQKVILSFNKKSENANKTKLSDREIEVLHLICQGLPTEQIAKELCLSQETIRTHRSSLLSKTNSNNAPALVMYAIKNKLIEI